MSGQRGQVRVGVPLAPGGKAMEEGLGRKASQHRRERTHLRLPGGGTFTATTSQINLSSISWTPEQMTKSRCAAFFTPHAELAEQGPGCHGTARCALYPGKLLLTPLGMPGVVVLACGVPRQILRTGTTFPGEPRGGGPELEDRYRNKDQPGLGEVTRVIDEGRAVDVVYLNFSKDIRKNTNVKGTKFILYKRTVIGTGVAGYVSIYCPSLLALRQLRVDHIAVGLESHVSQT
eukprot:g41568.t1